MSVSIYYEAKRKQPLTASERAAIEAITQRFSVDDQIESYIRSGQGLNWESFCLYDEPTAPDIIFEGATKLPDNTQDAMWMGVQHWCAALSEMRRAVPDAAWRVAVDDHKMTWDASTQNYDPAA
ncbi:MAG: hypothetical protein EBS05_09095 [Proteobacteria bacterium]|nr:hypothetical protein [Pseudomonadota bacterium]